MPDGIDRLVERVGRTEPSAQFAGLQHLAEAGVKRVALFHDVFGQLTCGMDAAQANATRTQQVGGNLAGLAAQRAVVDHGAVLVEAGRKSTGRGAPHRIESELHR